MSICAYGLPNFSSIRSSTPRIFLQRFPSPAFEGTSSTALRRLYANTDAPSATEVYRVASAHGPGALLGLSPRRSHPARSAISNGRRRLSTIPLSSRHLRAPTQLRLPTDHPVAAPLGEVLSAWNLTTLKIAGQQRVAVLIANIREVLAGHTDAGRPGALQIINEIPFFFRHRSLLMSSSYVLAMVRCPFQEVTSRKIRARTFPCVSTNLCAPETPHQTARPTPRSP